jgi:hypothetical protein
MRERTHRALSLPPRTTPPSISIASAREEREEERRGEEKEKSGERSCGPGEGLAIPVPSTVWT